MHKLKKLLQIACEILELIAAGFVLIGLVLSVLSLLKNAGSLFPALLDDISVFRHYLEEIFILVIGIEFLEMLCRPNADNVIQVLVFLVARHMIVGDTSPYEDLVSVISIVLLQILRKYLHADSKKTKSDRHPILDVVNHSKSEQTDTPAQQPDSSRR
ncbi:MAG: hypothetical protein HFH35_06965 [Eubacterium sp.]|mgnify:CR=1 FL=1|nr:hypothetical protein [Eubacterium sp.]